MKRRQFLPHSLDEVFTFFQKPENLSKLTPDSLNFTILTPSPIVMRVGSVIDYGLQISGFSVHWTTMVTEYNPPHRFIDVQLKGPYTFWHHTHSFEQDSNGGTWMNDEVHYVMPLGLLGEIMRTLWVKRQLEKIFDFRANIVAGFLGEGRSAVEKEDV